MIIYPAVDIRGGRCVRLSQGDFGNETVYAEDPVAAALKWVSMGARWLHAVDLDGARSGVSQNRMIISEIARKAGIPVQMGGGIRSMDDITGVLESGVARVILGTSAVRNPNLIQQALARYPEKIAVGIDAKGGRVAIEGWEKLSGFEAVEFAKQMEQLGCRVIIYTDIASDGMLKGPNIKAMEEMIANVGMDVIASGGVGSVQDIMRLREIGAAGVIIGKALYTGAVDLKEALKQQG